MAADPELQLKALKSSRTSERAQITKICAEIDEIYSLPSGERNLLRVKELQALLRERGARCDDYDHRILSNPLLSDANRDEMMEKVQEYSEKAGLARYRAGDMLEAHVPPPQPVALGAPPPAAVPAPRSSVLPLALDVSPDTFDGDRRQFR